MTTNVQVPLDELETLTRRYARYSRSAGGMSSVLGGVLCLFAYVGAPLLHGIAWTTPALVAVPAAWLLARGWLARRYYQRLGHVEEQETRQERLVHGFCVAVTLLVALAITVGFAQIARPHPWSLPAGMFGYLALLWLMVLAVWRWLRSPLDFIVGVFLFCQAALVSVGGYYPLIGTTHTQQGMLMSLVALMFPLAALALIARGVVEHRQFRELHLRLQQLRGVPTGDA